MSKSNLPRGLRRYIRKEKARIRREIFDKHKQKEQIEKLYGSVGLTPHKS